MNKALLVINFQNEFFKGGNLPLKGSRKALKKGKELLAYFRAQELPVIHITTENLSPDAISLVSQSEGAAVHPDMTPQEGEKTIFKQSPNSFFETDLKAYLKRKKIHEIVLIGFMTNISIDATVRAGKEFGFYCTVISDATGTKSLKFEKEKVKAEFVQLSSLATLCQQYGTVLSSKEYLKQEKKILKKEKKAKKAEASAEQLLENEESFSS